MNWLKRALVHLSVLVGIASIVLEQEHLVGSWFQKENITENVSSDTLLTKAIQEKLEEKSPKIPAPTPVVISDEISSLKELKSAKFSGPRLKLFSAFSDEQLKGRGIFDQLSTYSSVLNIFRQDVIGFERGTLRSGGYKESGGFDQIYYKIFYPSGRIAHVLIHDGEDLKLVIYMPTEKGYEVQSFNDGVWAKDEVLTAAQAQEQIQGSLQGSSPVLSASIGSI